MRLGTPRPWFGCRLCLPVTVEPRASHLTSQTTIFSRALNICPSCQALLVTGMPLPTPLRLTSLRLGREGRTRCPQEVGENLVTHPLTVSESREVWFVA